MNVDLVKKMGFYSELERNITAKWEKIILFEQFGLSQEHVFRKKEHYDLYENLPFSFKNPEEKFKFKSKSNRSDRSLKQKSLDFLRITIE